MTNAEQRQLESKHFNLFRGKVADFPEGEARHEDEPDFLVFTPSGVLGVELRQVFRPSSSKSGPAMQALESIRKDVVAEAQKDCELRGLPPLLVDVRFAHHGHLQGARRRDLAHELAGLVAQRVPPEASRVVVERRPFVRELPPEVYELSIARLPPHRSHRWTILEAGMVEEDTRALFQQAMSEKALLFGSYRRRCDRCWLLLVAEALRPSSFIEPDEASIHHHYESPFERTYFLSVSAQ
jgi:hypothetical protein